MNFWKSLAHQVTFEPENMDQIIEIAKEFLLTDDGLQGFIDEYGMSIIGTPTKAQALYTGHKIGAREYLLNRRKGYIDAGDQEGNHSTERHARGFLEHCYASRSRR